jgi:hypothetical protein
MKKLLVVLLSVAFIISSCSFGKNTKEIASIKEKTERTAKNNFKDNYDIAYNKSYDYAVITKKLDSFNEGEDYTLKIMIYDISSNKVIWGKKAGDGSAAWKSKYEVLINSKGRTNNMNTFIYNVKKKRANYL